MGLFERLIEVWATTPKWWKGFYLGFPLSLVLLVSMTGDPAFATLWAFLWASMIAAALWASEALKARMRGGSDTDRPRGDMSEHDFRRRR